MFYPALQAGPFKVPGYHDPDSQRIIGLILRPGSWVTATVYYKRSDDDYDVVIPTTFKGLYFKVKNPGLSGATDPFTGTYVQGDEVTDGTITWEAVNYNLMPPSETISSITVTATHSITIATSSNTATSVSLTIPPISAAAEAAGYFEVTTHVTKSNGEIDDYTLYFKVGER